MKNSFANVKLKFLNLENILPHFSVAGTSFIAFHFTAMTKTNKFNDGEFHQVVVFGVGT